LSPVCALTAATASVFPAKVLEISSQGLTDKERLIMYKSLAVVSRNLEKLCEEYK